MKKLTHLLKLHYFHLTDSKYSHFRIFERTKQNCKFNYSIIQQEQIDKLQKEIQKHQYLYYVEGKPEIEDWEFDLLMNRLEELENIKGRKEINDSPLDSIGMAPDDGKLVFHDEKMLSLKNTYNQEDIERFIRNLPGSSMEFCMEKKYDGMAASLKYDWQGHLIRVASRGDGSVGEDVTEAFLHHIPSLKSINLDFVRDELNKIDQQKPLEIRGEILMSKHTFDEINQGEKMMYKNPRNLVSGLMRMKKLKKPYELSFMGYQLLVDGVKNQIQALEICQTLGFETDVAQIGRSLQDIKRYIDDISKDRANLPFLIDGIVIKVNDFQQQNEIGVSSRYPKWAIAYKFPAEQQRSILQNIRYQVGLSGRIIPVAEFDPVILGGCEVKKATLHNFSYVSAHKLMVGSNILVERSADVIPRVTGIDEHVEGIHLPRECPCELKTTLVAIEGELYCQEREKCPAQLLIRLHRYCSKPALNIVGMGKKIIQMLLERELLNGIPDIYELKNKKIELMSCPGMAEKRIQQLLDSIEQSKKNATLDRILYGLNICGKEQSIVLSSFTMNQLLSIKSSSELNIVGIGPMTSEKIYKKLQLYNSELRSLSHLCSNPSIPQGTPSEFGLSNILSKQKIVITGTLSKPRSYFETLIKQHGGEVSTNPSKKTTFCIIGDSPSSSKLSRIQTLSIPTQSEEQFLSTLSNSR